MEQNIDITELIFTKFREIKDSRDAKKASFINKTARLYSHPIDNLNFEDSESLHNEIVLINEKKSRLSRQQRDFLLGLTSSVLVDIMKAQSEAESANKTDEQS